jgi:hypothetical protein
MLAYKDIIRNIAHTDKNYFLSNNINDKNKTKIKRKLFLTRKNTTKMVVKKEIKPDNKWILSLLFSVMIKNFSDIKSKYKQYKLLFDNYLVGCSENIKHEISDSFYKIQKIYNILNRFVYRYKYKKTKIVVNADMCLNELKEGDKNVISIIQDNSKYLFTVKDLINIINTSLTNAHSFFVEPKNIKNPYNNVSFNKSTLYNIYFYIKFNTKEYSDLLFKFFKCDFNITIFKNTYESILREQIITNYVNKSASNILLAEIKNMIDEFNELCEISKMNNKIIIDKDFPKNRLIKIMRPYFYLFCKAIYSYHPKDKLVFTRHFKQGLLRFNNFNREFGRKNCKFVYKTSQNFVRNLVCEITFNEHHIPFNNVEKQNENFLNDHLECDNIVSHPVTAITQSVNNDNNNDNESDSESDSNESIS